MSPSRTHHGPAARRASVALVLGALFTLVLACRGRGPVTPLVVAPPAAPLTKGAVPTPAARYVPPPISLTASDGTGLRMVALAARAVLDDPLALTELELDFDNPRDQVIEGRFEIRLPPGAQVTRFAMEIDGQWQEAEVVEKQRARQTYETFLHQQRDPALLERDTGNRFRARVFPIPAGARKRILVSYTQTLADPREPYRLGTRGLPWLERLDLRVLVADPRDGAHLVQRIYRERQVPTEDLVVDRDVPANDGLRRGKHVVARVQPLAGVDPGERTPLDRLTVLFDTSASRAIELEGDVDALGRLLAALARHHGSAALTVLAYDQRVVPIYEGPLVDFGADAQAALLARRALGASDLGQALQAVGKDAQRVLLVSDGLVSAGEDSDAGLGEILDTLRERGTVRLDVLAVGAVRDDDRLRRLVTGRLPAAGVRLRPEDTAERSAERLLQPTFDDLRLQVSGARWWSPTSLRGVQPSDHVLVYAELTDDQPLTVEISGAVEARHTIALRPLDSALVDHAVTRARIEGLVERLATIEDATRSQELRQDIIDLSVKHRVFNDFTAFLVLETEQDYARFGLDRRALTDILAVGPAGAHLLQRTGSPRGPRVIRPDVSTGSGSVRGVVTHAVTGKPLGGAQVMLDCSCEIPPREVTTDAAGRYSVEGLPPGAYTVQVLSGRAEIRKVVVVEPKTPARAEFMVDPEAERARLVRVETREAEPLPPDQQGPPPTEQAPAEAPPSEEQLLEFESNARSDGGGEEMRRLESPPPPIDAADAAAFANPDSATVYDFVDDSIEGEMLEPDMADEMDAPMLSSRSADREMGLISARSRMGLRGRIRYRRDRRERSKRQRPATVSVRSTRVDGPGMSRRDAKAVAEASVVLLEQCYFAALRRDPSLDGRLTIDIRISGEGRVSRVGKRGRTALDDPELLACIERSVLDWRYPVDWRPHGVIHTLVFQARDGAPEDSTETFDEAPQWGAQNTGALATVQEALALGNTEFALDQAVRWRETSPVDLLALLALGDVAQATGDTERAARAYGSILDLYPSRADMRRMASGRLESLRNAEALALATDSYRKAREQRPDHPSSHRGLAFALLAQGQAEEAFGVLVEGLQHPYPGGRFAEGLRVLSEDLGIVAAAWARQQPERATDIARELFVLGVSMSRTPSLRFVLTWETDANDVDLHLFDGYGDHAYYQHPSLSSGGQLYADVTNGYGPEAFVIEGDGRAFPYRMGVHYYQRGPMGYGMGKIQVLYHDGDGRVWIDDRPYIVMDDDAHMDLGLVSREILDQAREVGPAE